MSQFAGILLDAKVAVEAAEVFFDSHDCSRYFSDSVNDGSTVEYSLDGVYISVDVKDVQIRGLRMLSKKKQDRRKKILYAEWMVSQSVLGDLNILNSYMGVSHQNHHLNHLHYYTQEDRQDANVHADFGVDLSWLTPIARSTGS
eukprot:scaffold13390_cov96-Skeletonema_marinoi.AAC.6